ncbi:FadR/GntR family transcriptional regulator [Pseudofrankia inefficax]|uniref:GntR domain protein n=1 Tax=Pseudofrankia inefficax (strain DSM 45817 / CECT 9037 / DDB 130130 / EuI1c) TaxID=298654 RepID=E3J538_PSEI1|nr:FCD domain-containing protein [Pseudofrankia inefficax]ADP79489.1 GntR domain protein [Pseudofrankia inefficax]
MVHDDRQRTGEQPMPAIQAPKVAELVAAQLRRRIVTGELSDGAVLPREANLLDEFGVSRPSLREALRILETEGLVRIRRGNVGGAVVTRPTATSAAYHLGLTLRANEVTCDDLAVGRLAIEPTCAALAAALPDRQAIVAQLTRLIDESEASEAAAEFHDAAHAFHLGLTELCGNTTMRLIAGTLEAVWNAQEDRVLRADYQSDQRARRMSIASHRRIVAAIEAGRGDQASREMSRHLGDTHDLMTARYGSSVIELPAPASLSTLRAVSGLSLAGTSAP